MVYLFKRSIRPMFGYIAMFFNSKMHHFESK